jgi:hypothetical protein
MNDIQAMRAFLYETALSAGLPVISGDKCCRLLAWLYLYGGENEATVFNDRFREALLYAQKRLNLFGNEIPDRALLPVLQNYLHSVSDYYTPPEWVTELEKEYGVKGNRGRLFDGADTKVRL